jgi:hypothetical protein
MTIALRSATTLTAHAVCAAAGLRDGLRTAQFYVRDMANADGRQSGSPHTPTALSKLVAIWARGVDWFLSKGADISVRLLVPKWRELPSPFAPGMRAEVMEAIRQNRLVRTSLFTAYFFRAARHILERCTEAPHLLLEHRVDAARRIMAEENAATDGSAEVALANALIHLVEADPVARLGAAKPGYAFMQQADANIAVMATACLALLLAEEGKPIENLDEDEFFTIAGALIAPRLPEMAEAIAVRDVNALAAQLLAVKNLY